ncbi:MAG: DNA repair protein RecN [Betaproteobacteria bacterium]|nr:MAG: DNA repair protein RecN [Betaproteobacteria bacterium]
MLRRIAIRDFVIVRETQLDFEQGFTVLTGETGAGKSILIDALSFVLGDRADADLVRPGAKQAEISAEFELDSEQGAVASWLLDRGLEGDPGVCLVRRTLDATGRSRGFVNGHSSTVAQLRELAQLLLDIHGQHEHQSLLRPATQRDLLDAYGASSELAAQSSEAFRRWSDLTARHDAALRDADRLGREREALEWQAAELARLDFNPEAWAELNAEHARLAHASTLIESASEAIDAIAEAELSSLRLLNGALSRISRACDLDPGLKEVADVLDSARIELQEGVHALERYRSRLEIDPQRLAEIERRIQAVDDACRKFHLRPDALPSARADTERRLAELERDLDVTRLEREADEAKRAYQVLAERLTQARTKSAAKLGRQVSAAMQDLALAGGRFSVALEPLPEPSPHGGERVEFRVSSHGGLEPGPLGKVASGGELSRVSLAIQTVLSQVAQVPTLIFDEVDAGIGGRVAEIVGQMLHRLSARHQVMCVTHLAQVASYADRHYRVSKTERSGIVTSHVEELDEAERVREIARMLGGVRITTATLEHAAEMLREARRPVSAA